MEIYLSISKNTSSNMEITVDLDKEKEIKSTLLQADWMQRILKNPRYLQLDAVLSNSDKYIKRTMFGSVHLRREFDWQVIEVVIQNNLKVRQYKFNVNEFALYWAVKHYEHIIYKECDRRISITFYPLDFFDNTWRTESIIGKNIDVFELMARMRKYSNQYANNSKA